MHGFHRVASAVNKTIVANPKQNAIEILKLLTQAYKQDVAVVVFPELTLTGYTAADLFLNQTLIEKQYEALESILSNSKEISTIAIIGFALLHNNRLYNTAIICHNGGILGRIPKSYLTTWEDSMRYVFPQWYKFGTDKHLDGRPDNGYVRDFYVMRLAETYLLRAEAYLGKGGMNSEAAADINVIHARAQAPLVAAGDVDIDYILDERLRELYGEGFRTLTLGRLGLIYDRTKRFGYTPARASVQEHNNLLPIPQSVIDRNTGAVLEQNPGY